MANLHLVTGYAGQAHVSAADQGVLNASLFGKGQYVLSNGNKLSASVITNNKIRILDGDILMQGRHIRLEEGSFVDLEIENGTQGYIRNDLIVARYTKSSINDVEECNLVVIKGTNAESNQNDPEYESGDIIADHVLKNDMPLYRVTIEGINISSITPLFTMKDCKIVDLDSNKQDKTNLLTEENTISDSDAFPFYDESIKGNRKTLWSNIKSVLSNIFAAKSHNHSASQITSGTLPVERGGTGQTSLANMKTAMGFTRKQLMNEDSFSVSYNTKIAYNLPDNLSNFDLLIFSAFREASSSQAVMMYILDGSTYNLVASGGGGTQISVSFAIKNYDGTYSIIYGGDSSSTGPKNLTLNTNTVYIDSKISASDGVFKITGYKLV